MISPKPVSCLSIIVPARDEDGSVGSTGLHLELDAHGIPTRSLSLMMEATTNACKAYRKTVIDGIRPVLSPHFNITVELPLKAFVRGYSWAVIPVTWRNRRHGVGKLAIKEMGSRYLFIWLYVWLEKYFSCGDYHKPTQDDEPL